MVERLRRTVRQKIHAIEAKDPTGVVKVARETSEEAIIRSEGGTRINEWLWFNFDQNYPGQLNLHVSAVGTTTKARTEALRGYKQGMDELADRLVQNDPRFEGIDKIVGWSYLVFENKGALERRFGFDVPESEIDWEKGHALATMTREKFIAKPWNKPHRG